MNDELDSLLRDHYRAAANEIHADSTTVRRFQQAARPGVLRRWSFPTLAAAVTAAVLVAVAVLFWPAGHDPEPPRPMAPPAPRQTTTPPTPTPTTIPPSPATPIPSNTAAVTPTSAATPLTPPTSSPSTSSPSTPSTSHPH